MRNCFSVCLLIAAACSTAWSQTTPAPKTAPTKKPAAAAPAAKPAATASAQPTAVIETTAGKLTCTLFPDVAPIGVANFIGLAQGTKDWTNPISHAKKHGVPLYDGTIFHRVIPDFMIQGGCPQGTGTGGPGYKFADEFHPSLKHDKVGLLSMANAGPGTNGSQFFVTVAKTPWLDNKHSIFGEVIEGYDVVEKISKLPRSAGDRPVKEVKLNSVKIEKT
jgi:peptidyl-prolyl cis-trans isomerase A (cyclophilin A)